MRQPSLGLDSLIFALALAACGGQAPAAQHAPPPTAPSPALVAKPEPAPPLKNPQQETFERNFAAALDESGPRVKACFEEGKKRDPKLGGMFSATVDIAGNGKITGAELDAESTLKEPAVVKCMLEIVKAMGPIENPTQAASRVTYAMNFAADTSAAAPSPTPASPAGPTSKK